MSLGIFLDESNPTDLVEDYLFAFDYDDSSNVTLKINGEKDTVSLLDSRKMAQQLMRRFIIITQSLDPLPQKKFLSMRLMFNDSVDPNYQPYLFKDATFDRRPTLKMPVSADKESFSVGALDTKFHKVDLKVFSVSDFVANEMDSNSTFQYVDPFALINSSQQHPASVPRESQISSKLSEILQSSQPSIQPTQAVTQINNTNNIQDAKCDCGLECPANSSATKVCRICKRQVHGNCYGNAAPPRIANCMTCCYGKALDSTSSDFQDLMILRKCYRLLVRRRIFPASINIFKKQLIEDPKPFSERINFAITVLFQDGVLSLSKEADPTTPQRVNASTVLVDDPGLIIPNLSGEIYGKEYIWYFRYNTSKVHSCYMDIVPQSREQIDSWLEQVKALRYEYHHSLPATCDIQMLEINDTPTQDPIIIGQKRKHIDLNQYLNDESSVTKDTVDISVNKEVSETPKKIRKISVSKKTLRSNW